MKRFVLAFAAIAVTTVSATAGAQVWLRDRASTQGPGIRSGDLEYHPGIGVELGYDSNYFQRAPNNGSGYPVVDTVKLRVTPSFHVSTLTEQRKEGAPAPPPKFTFSGGAALIYSEYLTNTAIVPSTSANTGAGGLGRNRDFGVAADLALGIAPGRPWGFNILDQFTRTAQPSLDPDPAVGLDRDDNRASGELVYTKPGGLLDWHWGYAFGITYFEQPSARPLTNDRHEIFTRGHWKFLPRTAFIYDANVQFIRYTNSSSATGLSNSNPIRTRVGLNGLFTDRLSMLFLVGWGASFYENAAVGGDFDSVIGQVEARYFLTGAAPEAGAAAPATSSIAVGFTRDFFNYYIGNFYERDRGYVNVSATIAQRFFVSLETGVAAIKYSPIFANTGGKATVASTGYTDTRVDATLFGEYRVKDWLGFNATFQYLGEYSTTILRLTTPNGQYDPKFNRFQALVGVRAAF